MTGFPANHPEPSPEADDTVLAIAAAIWRLISPTPKGPSRTEHRMVHIPPADRRILPGTKPMQGLLRAAFPDIRSQQPDTGIGIEAVIARQPYNTVGQRCGLRCRRWRLRQ